MSTRTHSTAITKLLVVVSICWFYLIGSLSLWALQSGLLVRASWWQLLLLGFGLLQALLLFFALVLAVRLRLKKAAHE